MKTGHHTQHAKQHIGECAHVINRANNKDAMLQAMIEQCELRGLRFTTMRREVAHVLLDHHQPIGAYDLLEKISQRHGKIIAPVTIYRALDFLVEHGFVHKLETRNAYVACTHTHQTNDYSDKTTLKEQVIFMICDQCGGVDEIPAPHVHAQIQNVMTKNGFAVRTHVLEFSGLCGHCRSLA
jgi:Fur family zinc uptake transcriptional regulator